MVFCIGSLALAEACQGGALNADADGDGVRMPADCDDGDATAFPGAGETCVDGIDNDCDGYAAGCGVAGRMSLSEAQVRIVGDGSGCGHRPHVSGGVDADGDGKGDLVITASDDCDGGVATYVVPVPLPGDIQLGDRDPTVRFAVKSYQIPSVILGDLDGDGRADLIAEQGDRSVDYAWVGATVYVFGDPMATGLTPEDARASVYLGGGAYEPQLAVLAGGAADAPAFVAGMNSVSGGMGGGAWLVPGPLDGAADVEDIGILLATSWGTTALATGDLDGDGQADVAIGMVDEGVVALFLAPTDAGSSVHLPDVYLTGGVTSPRFGGALAIGDIDADGYGDLVVGDAYTPGVGAGAASIFRGPPVASTAETADATVVTSKEDQRVGTVLSVPGDVDGDGREELLLGDPQGCWNHGCAYLLSGGRSGVVALDSATAVLVGADEGEDAASALGGAGDADGDGFADLFVTAPSQIDQDGNRGLVYLLPGGPGF